MTNFTEGFAVLVNMFMNMASHWRREISLYLKILIYTTGWIQLQFSLDLTLLYNPFLYDFFPFSSNDPLHTCAHTSALHTHTQCQLHTHANIEASRKRNGIISNLLNQRMPEKIPVNSATNSESKDIGSERCFFLSDNFKPPFKKKY